MGGRCAYAAGGHLEESESAGKEVNDSSGRYCIQKDLSSRQKSCGKRQK